MEKDTGKSKCGSHMRDISIFPIYIEQLFSAGVIPLDVLALRTRCFGAYL